MNVSLTVELERWVQQKVESGSYTSASEVVREALRALRDREDLRGALLADLRHELAVGVDELDAGHGLPFDDDAVASVKASARRRLTAS